jgi:ATP-dependent DNA helicase RecQ
VNPREILRRYWSYDTFRFPQEEIVQAVLQNQDALVLMPTGGGKSVCYQVPALCSEGITIVVSPLIALMKDQVIHLQNKNIPAIALHAGMTHREIDRELENCIQLKYKLVYVSPERLGTELFRVRLQKMKVNLLAVDEAHCISQWGHDFRPEYLQIAAVRPLIPGVPVLALTATATQLVQQDIIKYLSLKNVKYFTKSFFRDNLSYSALDEENKGERILKMLDKIKGCSIIYARSRRQVMQIAFFLDKNKISTTSYHAGMQHALREKNQHEWLSGEKRIMVCTNAFGMGIDKPDVRLVIHYDVPDCIESYFQEAGRAGRDEKKSFAVVLFNRADKRSQDKQLNESEVKFQEIKNIYRSLGNYFQIPVGSGNGNAFDFDLKNFSSTYNYSPLTIHHSLKILERQDFIQTSDSVFFPSRLFFLVDKEKLYQYQLAHPKEDTFIKTLLRTYGGLFEMYSPISEKILAKNIRQSEKDTEGLLRKLAANKIVDYIPASDKPKITFLKPRPDEKIFTLNENEIKQFQQLHREKQTAMWKYLENIKICRSRQLLSYFGEEHSADCGICDVCLKRHINHLTKNEQLDLIPKIQKMLSKKTETIDGLSKSLRTSENKITEAVRWMLDNELIEQENGLLGSK